MLPRRPPPPHSPTPPPALRIAHRGGLAHGPENSLEAIRVAADHGADAVELDVRMREGRLVCAHDRGQDGPPAHRALELAFELDLLVELDVKGHGIDGSVEELAALFETTWAWERAWVSSFHPLVAYRLRWADPRFVVGWSMAPHRLQRLPLWPGWPNWLRVQLVEPHASLITPRRLARWQAMGLGVVTWGVEGEAARAFLDQGVSVVVDRVF